MAGTGTYSRELPPLLFGLLRSMLKLTAFAIRLQDRGNPSMLSRLASYLRHAEVEDTSLPNVRELALMTDAEGYEVRSLLTPFTGVERLYYDGPRLQYVSQLIRFGVAGMLRNLVHLDLVREVEIPKLNPEAGSGWTNREFQGLSLSEACG